MVCFVPSVCLSIRKSCQRHDCFETGKYSKLGRTLYDETFLTDVQKCFSDSLLSECFCTIFSFGLVTLTTEMLKMTDYCKINLSVEMLKIYRTVLCVSPCKF